MRNIDVEFVLSEDGQRVTMRFQQRDYWGRINKRWQTTMSRRRFERSLIDAKISVPWSAVR